MNTKFSRSKKYTSKIQVYILTRDEKTKSYSAISSLFCRDYFDVYPTTLKGVHKSNLLIKTLSGALINKWVLYIKDNSITNADSDTVRDVIYKAIEWHGNGQKWDLFYLSKWLDRCDLYTKNHNLILRLHNSWITQTHSPNGEQAILFSPGGVKRVLGLIKSENGKYISQKHGNITQEIENGSLVAVAITPNLFSFDVLNAKSISDLAKTSECRKPDAYHDTENKMNDSKDSISKILSPFAWFIVVVIIVVFILWVLYHLGAKPSNKDKFQKPIAPTS